MRVIEYEIDGRHDGMQAGRFLQGKGYSRAVLTSLKHSDGLKLNGVHVRTIDPVRTGDIITVCFKDASEAYPNASLNADVLYDDDDVAVFDKPAGMPVHSSIWHGKDTLENLFAALYPECFFHAVGRLDKDTSGVVAAAKNKYAASVLMSGEGRKPGKLYYAVTDIGFADAYGKEGEIIAPIAREREDHLRRVVREDGEYAHTKYRIIACSDKYCLHEISLVTGRTHQIRVHYSYKGFPLIGDELYGGDTTILKRQALHCGRLEFRQPVTNEDICIRSELPKDILSLFNDNIGKYCIIT